MICCSSTTETSLVCFVRCPRFLHRRVSTLHTSHWVGREEDVQWVLLYWTVRVQFRCWRSCVACETQSATYTLCTSRKTSILPSALAAATKATNTTQLWLEVLTTTSLCCARNI